MAAHRYWRIYITANNSNVATGYTSIKECELRASVGGADECSGGTASADSAEAGHPALEAFDNSNSTEWISGFNVAMPHWLKYDFGAGNDKDIVEVSRSSSWTPHYAPRDFQLQYSDNNSTWTALLTVTGETRWTSANTLVYSADRRYDVGSAAQNWRVFMSAHGGGASFVVVEVQMRLTAGGADECTGGQAFASSDQFASGGADLAFDDTSAYWSSYQTNELVSGSWLVYKFTAAKEIVEVTIKCGDSVQVSSAPTDLKIQRWDGSAWEDKYTATGLTWTADETKTFSWAVPASARPVVFVCT